MLNSGVKVHNGTVSHIQLLNSLPNLAAQEDEQTALKILKSSLYAYNSKCVPKGISGSQCEKFLQSIPLPQNSQLLQNCQKIIDSVRDGHHPFRRLLPRNYKDGFNEACYEFKILIFNYEIHIFIVRCLVIMISYHPD